MECWKSRRRVRQTRIVERYLRRSPPVSVDKSLMRAQSSCAPAAVKSILPSKEDEAKRREARRKSLGKMSRMA